ncbi:hypothetical protein [Halorubrum salinum]|uniref:hypothetical protein n=1 Tax=Halorubrum salinum TaxID=767517 RepID=UPI0021119113|nr:hypothetical protein [Halorubrum salinum]
MSTNSRGRGTNSHDPWIVVAAAATAVLGASLLPIPDVALGGVPRGVGGAGPLPAWVSFTTPFHLVGYAALGALVARATRVSLTVRRRSRVDGVATGGGPSRVDSDSGGGRVGGATGLAVVALGVTVAAAVGFGVELAQSTIPWRSFAWIDVGVNVVGAVVGAGGYAIRWTVSVAPR